MGTGTEDQAHDNIIKINSSDAAPPSGGQSAQSSLRRKEPLTAPERQRSLARPLERCARETRRGPERERATGAGGMNREQPPAKSPEEMYIQQKVRVLLMLKKMGSNLTQSEEAFLRNYAGVVHSQMSQLPQHPIDQGAEDVVMAFSRSETEDRRQ
ncbi:beta-catenin-interacting protein 1 isoform X1 [Arapaima gigas]